MMNTIPIFQTTFKRLSPFCLTLFLAACAGSGSPTDAVPDGYYRVKPGDTLSQIAKRHGQSIHTLASWNNLRDTSKIEVGRVLRIRRNTRPISQSNQATQAVAPTNRLNLQWPVENGRNSVIKQYNGTTNKGIDIAGTPGEPVKSAAAGKVLYVGEEVRGYGKLILISHNDYAITAYAHNDALLVQKDQQVAAGQQIATMGSTDTDSVKLHFEVRLNGKAVNPMPYLPN